MLKKILCLSLIGTLSMTMVSCSSSETATTTDSGEENNSGATWPSNVEIVVPAGAGGDTDFNSRLLAQYLSEDIDANFVVSNVKGNGGATGTRQVKNATPDGSSVLFYHSAFVVNELCGTTDYGFDAYEFVAIAAQNPGNVITVNSELGVNTVSELIDYTQSNPDELKIAAQTGATSYAEAALLQSNGLEAVMVDAGSSSDRLAALLGGHVDIISASYGSVKDYVDEGTLTVLATYGEEDIDLGDGSFVPSLITEGYDMKLPFYYFFAFPKGTDQALVDELSSSVQNIVENNTEYQEKIKSTYYQKPVYYNAEDGLAKFTEVYDILDDIDFSGN
ncbi:MAG: tripartite tricarboxylate transporter substrate binding protein [Lachnospirales bacterium]